MEGLGCLYAEGNGVEQSAEKALEYLQQAADLGAAGAFVDLGELYENGLGVEQSYAKAAEYYWLAAEQGIQEAAEALNRLAEEGHIQEK